MWIATRGGFVDPLNVIVNGPLGGHWWRVLTTQFSYFDATGGAAITGAGVYQFVTLTVVGVFGWLLETRHGPLVVVALFLLGGAGGALAAHAIDSQAVISGANGGALALLCAWAVPDLLAQRQRHEYEGDLLGAGALGLVMLAMPIARPEANAIAGGVGVLAGYTLGLGLARAAAR
jgi:hypothetical protein